jgi:hypothetical protein
MRSPIGALPEHETNKIESTAHMNTDSINNELIAVREELTTLKVGSPDCQDNDVLHCALTRLQAPPTPEEIQRAEGYALGTVMQMIELVSWLRGYKDRGQTMLTIDDLLHPAEQSLGEELELIAANKPDLFRRIAMARE